MLKYAFMLGEKLAFDDEGFGITPEQMSARQGIGGVGGGLIGAGLGGLLGKFLGGQVADTLEMNPATAKLVGAGLGALVGGGLGGYVGSRFPAAKVPTQTPPPPAAAESSLGVLPVALNQELYGGYDGGYGEEEPLGLYPEYY